MTISTSYRYYRKSYRCYDDSYINIDTSYSCFIAVDAIVAIDTTIATINVDVAIASIATFDIDVGRGYLYYRSAKILLLYIK